MAEFFYLEWLPLETRFIAHFNRNMHFPISILYILYALIEQKCSIDSSIVPAELNILGSTLVCYFSALASK